MSGFSQGFGQVLARAREGFIGEWMDDSQLKEYHTGINESPQRKQVSTITVDSDPGVDTPGTVTINGIPVTFNTGNPTGGTTGIATTIATAINLAPLVRGQVIAVAAGAVVTLTGIIPGLAFTVVEVEAFLSTATPTTPLEADPIPFGRATVTQGFATGEGERLVTLATLAAFVPQVQTVTVDTGAATDHSCRVYEVRGPRERILLASATVTGNVTAATQAASVRAALNTALPANTVDVGGAGADIVGTAEIAGLEFDLEIDGVVTKINTTGPSTATSLARAWAGIALRSLSDEAPTIGALEGEYPANDGFRYARKGSVWVTNSDGVSEGEDVYVELTAGANAGKLYNAGGATRVALGRDVAQWKRSSREPGNNLAGVELR